VGSAALYHLARRGARVLGIDRFPPGHDRGSSHGHTRVIRLAYFEHADYVSLLHRAYELWESLMAARQEPLYVQTGILEMGPQDGEIVPGVLEAARQHALEVEHLSAAEIQYRFPGVRAPEDWAGVYETRAGYLRVEECVRAHAEVAVAHGAALCVGEAVLGWETQGDHLVVRTDRDTYCTAHLVVTAGAWAPRLLASLGVELTVLRKPLLWYRPTTSDYRAESGFPVWIFETPAGVIYGFPEIDDRGLKLAEHSGGLPVANPFDVNRDLLDIDRPPVDACVRAHLPGLSTECLQHVVCMYTASPDGHFIIDRHPDNPRISFVTGLSGHGFKFTSVLGEIMADFALEGGTAQPVQFLGLSRFRH
jgi:sarcosine oxidase